jgi:tRNA-Thr(GGU) m(6)t(6)A37 methyltransferase TsaA
MNELARDKGETYQIHPIGHVHRAEDVIHLEILEPFRPGLKQLNHFSHVMVLWWADRRDNQESRGWLQTRPPYAEEHLTGVFATRAEYRPNPIALTTCEILDVDEENGLLRIANIDAYDGTRVVDLKAYFPVCDRVKDAHIPEWLSGWPEWMPDEGIGLWDGES